MLRGLAETLTWQHNSSFLIQLTFMLGPFLEEVTSSGGSSPVSEHLRTEGEGWHCVCDAVL